MTERTRRGSPDDEFVVIDLPLRLRPDEFLRLDAAVTRARTRPAGPVKVHGDDEVARARLCASAFLALRRERERQFEGIMFSDPSWDMLLDLFIQRADGKLTTVTSACIGASAPSTTALRHLSMLIEQGYVERRGSEHDQRVFYVGLSHAAFDQMVLLLTRHGR